MPPFQIYDDIRTERIRFTPGGIATSEIIKASYAKNNPDPSNLKLMATKDLKLSPTGWVWAGKQGDKQVAFAAPPPKRSGASKSNAPDSGTASSPDRVRVGESREVLDLDLGPDFQFQSAGGRPSGDFELLETSDPRTPTGWVWVGPNGTYQAPFQSSNSSGNTSSATSAQTRTGQSVSVGSELAETSRSRQTQQVRRQQQSSNRRTLISSGSSRRSSSTILGE